MTFFTMLKKQKKLNNLSSAFTLIELLVVIIVIGLLAATLSFNFAPDRLQLAADQIIKDIKYTQSLALKEDKYQPFPNKNDATEYNRTKYWFKQWWQIRFVYNSGSDKHWWYEIFSDQPDGAHSHDNFDKLAKDPADVRELYIAKDPLTNKLLIGRCDNGTNFPTCDKIEPSLDLTKTYNIKRIIFSHFFALRHSKRLLFDNQGNVFIKESGSESDRDGDIGDINPLDESNRVVLTQNVYFRLCLDNPCDNSVNRCIQINLSPSGALWKSKCE